MSETKIEVPAPGFFIKEELEARDWSQSDLAYILGMSVQQVNPVLSGKRSISTDMAKALGKAFDVAPEFFSRLQTRYDHYKSQDADPAIARRARLQEHFPIREMIKRGWFQDIGEVALLEAQVTRFFGRDSINDVPYLAHAAFKTSYDEEASTLQYAWLYRVQQIAAEIPTRQFSRNKLMGVLKNDLPSLLIEPEEIRHIPDLLSQCGVRLVVVERLPQAKIDGACIWLNEKEPVVGLSLRHDRIDNFWFVLRHELEHVLRGDGKETEGIIEDLDGERSGEGSDLPEEERIANTAAADFCAPRDELKALIQRKHPYLSERDVVGFARRIRRHPGLVVGQVQRLRNDYKFLRKHLVKVKSHLLPYVPYDGWGDVFPIDL